MSRGQRISRARHVRVLLVDDDEPSRVFVKELLCDFGFVVIVARDGIDAVAAAQQSHPDVIVMDFQMPRLDGLSAVRRLRADPATAGIPTILFTADAEPKIRAQAATAGCVTVLKKPCPAERLVSRICQAAGGAIETLASSRR